MIEFQQTRNLQVGNKYLAYSDSKDDYWVRWNGVKMLLAQGQTQFYETDNMLIAHFTSILKVVEKEQVKTLTNFVQSFGYGDSLVVFQDKIGVFFGCFFTGNQ